MITAQDLLGLLAGTFEPATYGNYSLNLDVPVGDDGTVDAQELVQAVLHPAVILLARFAVALAAERGLDPWDVVESMRWDLRFDDLLGPLPDLGTADPTHDTEPQT